MKNFANPIKDYSLTRIMVATVVLLASMPVLAQQRVTISLSGAAEVPPVTSSASGSGEFSVGPDHSLSGKFTVSGMTASAAHVHEGGVGKDGPVIVRLAKTADGSFMVPPGTKLTDAQYAAFTAGNLYVNVHSEAHPGGEVRAQLLTGGAAPAPTRSSGY